MKNKRTGLLLLMLLAVILLHSLPAFAGPPTNGLVAWYPFSGNANDASGNVHNGTVTGAALTPDKSGTANSAYSFNGTGKYIDIPNSSAFDFAGKPFTIAAWVKITGAFTGSGYGTVFDRLEAGTGRGYRLDYSPSSKTIRLLGSTLLINNPVTNPVILTEGTWYHLAVVADGANATIYLNGVAVLTGAYVAGAGSFPLRIGECQESGTAPFNGVIDEVMIYNRALTASESAGLQGGLVASYPFSGNANDASGNGYNGTAANATLTTDRLGTANSAYSFNGTGKYIDIPNSSAFDFAGKPFTIAAWVKITGAFTGSNGGYGAIFDRIQAGTGNGYRLDYSPSSKTIRLLGSTSLINNPVTNPVTLNNDTWYHLVVVADGANATIYLNDMAVLTGPYVAGAGSVPPRIGECQEPGMAPFNGVIDEILVYNRALTAAEISYRKDGLVAWYPFSGNANDVSGNGYNGEVANATLTTDNSGTANSAYSFNGTGKYINIPNSSAFDFAGKPFTIAAWVKITGAFTGSNGDYGAIFDRLEAGTGNGYRLDYSPSSKTIRLLGSTPLINNPVTNPVILTEGTWYHLAVVADGANATIYLNGVAVLTGAYVAGVGSFPLRIGECQESGTAPFNGVIDEVMIYNRALTASESAGLQGGLVAWYPFSGNANDASGNGNNGTAANATLTTDRLGNANSAYSFNGTGKYINIPNSSAFDFAGKPFSIAAWVKITGAFTGQGGYGTIFDRIELNTGNGYRLDYSPSAKTIRLLGSTSLTNNPVTNPVILPEGTWYHLVVIADGANATIYLNGNSVLAGLYVAGAGSVPPRIGEGQTPGAAPFNGVIDEVMIYNRALTASEFGYPLTVTKTGTGTGNVTATGCTLGWSGATASCSITEFATVTLTATPDSGYYFMGWAGACSGTGACQVTMDAAKSVTARFDKRFVDLQNGTMLDVASRLIWLKNADCYGYNQWDSAMTASNGLASGQCGLIDGSSAGDWHLPTVAELLIFVDAGYRTDTLNAAGFNSVSPEKYWSSSSDGTGSAWYVYMEYGSVYSSNKSYGNYVWPVRSGQSGSLGSLVLSPATASYVSTLWGLPTSAVITISNSGGEAVTLSRLFFSGTDADQFTVASGVDTTCVTPLTLAPGANCTAKVSFSPTSVGNKSASLGVASNSLAAWPKTDLSGTPPLKAPQYITVTTPAPAMAVFNNSFTVAATASSGLPVSYSSGSPTVCSNSGATFSMIAAGDCVVRYNQAGNGVFVFAPQVSSTTATGMVNQTIMTVSFSSSTLFVNGSSTISATANSGLKIIFSSLTPQVCSVNGSSVIGIGPGICTIAADQPGDVNYHPAPRITANIATVARFVDLYNGTVFDRASMLLWLKSANCFSARSSSEAASAAASLVNGQCGLNDGTLAGDWRRPTVDELRSFTDAGYRSSALNASGFSGVQAGSYWASIEYAGDVRLAWYANMNNGDVYVQDKTVNSFVWPVRAETVQAAKTPGLVAWYWFNGNGADASGNGHAGTVTGAVAAADRFGNPNSAYNFINSHVDIPKSVAFDFTNKPFTISAWVKLNGANTGQAGYGAIFDHGNYRLDYSTSSHDFRLLGSSNLGVLYPSTMTAGTWYHVAAVSDGIGHGSIYVNGQLIGSGAYTLTGNSDVPAIIGDAQSVGIAAFNGSIDDVRIYGTPLTATDVLTLYNAPNEFIFTLAPTATGFALTPVGGTQPAPMDFSISNLLNAANQISSIAIAGADADQFSVAPGGSLPCPSLSPTLAVGAACTVVVSFSPTSAGAKAATLRVSVGSATYDAALRGASAILPLAATAAAADITSSGATLNGTVNANTIDATISFEYGPTSTYGTSVTATPATVSGSSATSVSAAVGSLMPGATYHYRVVATTASGTVYGNDATFTAAKASTTTSIIAHSPNPSAAGQPLLVSFTVTAPSGTPTGTVTINAGAASCTATVAAGSCTLTPSDTGTLTLSASYGGDVTFGGSTTGVSHTVVPLAPLTTLSRTSLDAGALTVGTTGIAQDITLTNSGFAPLAITGIPAAAGDFAITNNCPASLPGGAFCSISVSFHPTAAGARNTNLNIVDSLGTHSVALTGLGTIATSSIVIDPNSATTLYAGLDGAGVYKKSGADDWSAVNAGLTNLQVKALVIDKNDSHKLYAASYGNGLFKSTASDILWSACGTTGLTNLNLVSLVLDASGKLYVGTEAGVFVSTDNCATWTAMNSGLPN